MPISVYTTHEFKKLMLKNGFTDVEAEFINEPIVENGKIHIFNLKKETPEIEGELGQRGDLSDHQISLIWKKFCQDFRSIADEAGNIYIWHTW